MALAVTAALSGYGAYDYFYASNFITTDNAYTSAETASVTPSVGGIVREVRVTDTSYVQRGDVLVSLRRDANHERGFWIWATADNLRVAALSAVECAELMAASRPRGQVQ